jgi:hypothetical protein
MLLLGGRVAPVGLGPSVRKSTNLGLGPFADRHVVTFLSQNARYLYGRSLIGMALKHFEQMSSSLNFDKTMEQSGVLQTRLGAPGANLAARRSRSPGFFAVAIW